MSELLSQQAMPRKAKAKLQRLLASKEITPEGVEWLICSTDPFHDSELPTPGLPDGQIGRTTRKWLRKQVTLTRPSTVAAGSQWEVNVGYSPLTYCRHVGSDPASSYLAPGSRVSYYAIPTAQANNGARVYPGVSINS